MKDGPHHFRIFKASVSVNGVTFHSPGPCLSSTDAHDKAAMVVFNHFSSAELSPPADLHSIYENQLQNYAQRKNLPLPISVSKHEVPPQAYHFKTTVIVVGQSFDGPTFFNTLKEAGQAAAKVALTSLSIDSLQKELTQREGYCKPIYITTQSGPPHMPTFFSVGEVEGKEFLGREGKSKKASGIGCS